MSTLADALRNSAQRFLAEAIELELEHFLKRFQADRCSDGQHRVVRNGYHPERHLLTGIGPVTVRIPKIRTRIGRPAMFRSELVPAYLRRTCPRTTAPESLILYLQWRRSRIWRNSSGQKHD